MPIDVRDLFQLRDFGFYCAQFGFASPSDFFEYLAGPVSTYTAPCPACNEPRAPRDQKPWFHSLNRYVGGGGDELEKISVDLTHLQKAEFEQLEKNAAARNDHRRKGGFDDLPGAAGGSDRVSDEQKRLRSMLADFDGTVHGWWIACEQYDISQWYMLQTRWRLLDKSCKLYFCEQQPYPNRGGHHSPFIQVGGHKMHRPCIAALFVPNPRGGKTPANPHGIVGITTQPVPSFRDFCINNTGDLTYDDCCMDLVDDLVSDYSFPWLGGQLVFRPSPDISCLGWIACTGPWVGSPTAGGPLYRGKKKDYHTRRYVFLFDVKWDEQKDEERVAIIENVKDVPYLQRVDAGQRQRLENYKCVYGYSEAYHGRLPALHQAGFDSAPRGQFKQDLPEGEGCGGAFHTQMAAMKREFCRVFQEAVEETDRASPPYAGGGGGGAGVGRAGASADIPSLVTTYSRYMEDEHGVSFSSFSSSFLPGSRSAQSSLDSALQIYKRERQGALEREHEVFAAVHMKRLSMPLLGAKGINSFALSPAVAIQRAFRKWRGGKGNGDGNAAGGGGAGPRGGGGSGGGGGGGSGSGAGNGSKRHADPAGLGGGIAAKRLRS